MVAACGTVIPEELRTDVIQRREDGNVMLSVPSWTAERRTYAFLCPGDPHVPVVPGANTEETGERLYGAQCIGFDPVPTETNGWEDVLLFADPESTLPRATFDAAPTWRLILYDLVLKASDRVIGRVFQRDIRGGPIGR